MDPLDNKFCPKPFEYVDLHYINNELRIYVCCPTWLPQSIGDLKKKDFNEIWNGGVIKEIRKSMIESTFSHCNKELCPEIQSKTIHDKRFMYSPVYRSYLDFKDGEVPFGPKIIYFSEDRTCNLSCPSCRTDYITLSDADSDDIISIRENVLPQLLKNAERLYICSSGDPFVSKIYRDFLFNFEGDKYPNLKININTNGVLFNEENYLKMEKIHKNLSEVYVSLDAALEPTYKIVRRGGNFQKVTDNLHFLKKLRDQKKLDHLQIDFVVQDHNFKEMADFVKLGKKIGVDKVYFQRISNWGTFNEIEFKKRDICSEEHPYHQDFLVSTKNESILSDRIVKKGNLSAFIRPGMRDHLLSLLKKFSFLRYLRRWFLYNLNRGYQSIK